MPYDYAKTWVKRGHPLATRPEGSVVDVHRLVLWEKLNGYDAPCHWCGRPLRWQPGTGLRGGDVLTADHVNANRSDNRPENLVPACMRCNGVRSRLVADDEPWLPAKGGRGRVRATIRACGICGAEFLTPTYRPANYCSSLCRTRATWRARTDGISDDELSVDVRGKKLRAERRECAECGTPFVAARRIRKNYCSLACRQVAAGRTRRSGR